jgi:hypothetical protein
MFHHLPEQGNKNVRHLLCSIKQNRLELNVIYKNEQMILSGKPIVGNMPIYIYLTLSLLNLKGHPMAINNN